MPHTARACSWRLTQDETEAILAQLTGAFAQGKMVFQAYYEALDAGNPVASLSSWYRIARAYLEAQRPTRRRSRKRSTAMPQWEATAPMQVWSWDITKLKGPYSRLTYDFYVVIDVFSRQIMGWRVEETESDELAADMFQQAFTTHQGQPHTVHADRGSSMTSTALAALYAQAGITQSLNRPRVSNDNPFSETWFKTCKYSPDYPQWFTDLHPARAWAETFVHWYNTTHRHSSLAGHTPASVHDGSWVQVHHARQTTQDALQAANPDRYRKPVQIKTPYALVALNYEGDKPTHRLTTG